MRSLLSQELQIVDCESLHSFSRVIFQVLKQKLQLCGYEKYQLISLFYVPKQYRKGKKIKSDPSYLLWDINEGGGSQLGEGVQGDDDHGCRGIGVDQVLEKLSAAGRQAGIMVHVLQHWNQLQLQVHRCVQAWVK